MAWGKSLFRHGGPGHIPAAASHFRKLAAAALLTFSCSCGMAAETPTESRAGHAPQARPQNPQEQGDCFDAFMSHDFPAYPATPPREEAVEEILASHGALSRTLAKTGRGRELDAYVNHFNSARFTNGTEIYPNAARAIISMEGVSDSERATLARKVASSVKSRRTRNLWELLAFMPKTAVSLMGAMEPEESEDMAGLLLNVIGSSARFHDSRGEIVPMDAPLPKNCDAIRDGSLTRMTRGQLGEFDESLYRIAPGLIESETECKADDSGWTRCDTASRSYRNLCSELARRQENGELLGFGIPHLDYTCFGKIREDPCGSPYSVFGRDGGLCIAIQKRRHERQRMESKSGEPAGQ